MSITTDTYIGTLEATSCPNCGITFGVPPAWIRDRRDSHASFWCPNGHVLSFQGPTEADRLRSQLAREKHWREQEDAEHRAFRERFDSDRLTAAQRARWIGKPQRHAFWKGVDAAKCGCGPDACPYPTARGGFRRAWFKGYGEDEPPPRKLLAAGPPPVVDGDFEIEP